MIQMHNTSLLEAFNQFESQDEADETMKIDLNQVQTGHQEQF
jgi:hypothetical protein